MGSLDQPRLVSVSQGAAEVLFLNDPGGYSGPWQPGEVPYLVEPMDCLASRLLETVVFVGPARCGKTAGLILGWIAHATTSDIGRMMVMHMTETRAAHLSKLDVENAIHASPQLLALKSPRREDNNIGLRQFANGMAIRFSHPTATETAGATYRYVALTDYDRYPVRAGAGGETYRSAHKRSQTLGSRRMTLVETSPERILEDPNWKPSTAHQAPPVSGGLGLYNQGDRRMQYWQCPHCSEYFIAYPSIEMFASLPTFDELMGSIETADLHSLALEHAFVYCPHNGCQIEPAHRPRMNDAGVWLKDGQSIDGDGKVSGEVPHNSIASFWLGGVAAAYQSWAGLINNYLLGIRQYATSGLETDLRESTYTDIGTAYVPRYLVDQKSSDIDGRLEKMARHQVPEWTRFLLCSVDVQGGALSRYEVQVHAIGVDIESAVIDRYAIIKSPRDENARIDPSSYPEDWDALTTDVINASYPIDEDRRMQVLHTFVDYGGEAGVSTQAAAWRQRLLAQGMGNRATLTKGDSKTKEMVQISTARDWRGKRMHDVPLLLFNPDRFKDLIAASMKRTKVGYGYMHFGDWLERWFFDELSAEARQLNGTWKRIRKRNEALDLWANIWAGAWYLGPADTRRRFDWGNPPKWAAPLDQNSMVISETRAALAEEEAKRPPKKKTVMDRMHETRRRSRTRGGKSWR